MKELFFALPGFLGLPHDWEDLFHYNPFVTNLQAIDIFSSFAIRDFWEWAEQFNATVRQQSKNFPLDVQRILIGYSLGGRLALHALLHDQTLWHGAIIISVHSGLNDPLEKKQRLKLDCAWAQRFEKDPWDQLMQDWNAQSVFQNDKFMFSRQEKDYSRSALACALRTWSLGNQEDLRPKLELVELPLLWMTGSNDSLYSSLANQMALKHPASKIISFEKAGHRVPWQQPEAFHYHINQFLKR